MLAPDSKQNALLSVGTFFAFIFSGICNSLPKSSTRFGVVNYLLATISLGCT